jgi:hypothetical protein
VSTLGDAISAVKSIILIEERVKNQGAKLEKLADLVVGLDRRMVRVETTLDLAVRHAGAATGVPTITRQRSAASGNDE